MEVDMEVAFKITKAILVIGDGPDMVSLHTDSPATMPNVSNQPLILRFDVVSGSGLKYLTETLHIPSTLIETIKIR
jgi:hypothetical protein